MRTPHLVVRSIHPFQSAPDREVGRCILASAVCSDLRCFNPRPTVRSGDANLKGQLIRAQGVSIRARP